MHAIPWATTFVISGALLVLSLFGLFTSVQRDIWLGSLVVGCIALPVCLFSLKKLRQQEKAGKFADLADGAWLRDADTPCDFDIGGD